MTDLANGPGSGQPGHWRPGTLPPGSRALLIQQGVDPDDAQAVRAYYEGRASTGYPLPYWYAAWARLNPENDS